MAYTIDERLAAPAKAASAINEAVAVIFSASSADEVLPAASSMAAAQQPFGLSIATAASPGDPVAVQYAGIGRAIAGASVGVGVNVGVATTTGALGPIAASAGAFVVGVSRTPADAGEFFSVLIRPGKVGA